MGLRPKGHSASRLPAKPAARLSSRFLTKVAEEVVPGEGMLPVSNPKDWSPSRCVHAVCLPVHSMRVSMALCQQGRGRPL